MCYLIGHGEDFSEIRWCTIVEEVGLLTHITSVFEVWCADPVAGPPSIPMKIWQKQYVPSSPPLNPEICEKGFGKKFLIFHLTM